MSGGYLLTKDVPAEKVTHRLAGLMSNKEQIHALKGDLLIVIPGEELVPRSDGEKPHNYRLARNMSVTLRADDTDVAPLDAREYGLLEAMKSSHLRFSTFLCNGKMDWGLSLQEGNTVFVPVNPEDPQMTWNRCRAVVHWVGELGGEERGTFFGVEIMVGRLQPIPVLGMCGSPYNFTSNQP